MPVKDFRQVLKEIVERNKALAPEGEGLWPAAGPMRQADDVLERRRHHFEPPPEPVSDEDDDRGARE